jgi:hypothetical protein
MSIHSPTTRATVKLCSGGIVVGEATASVVPMVTPAVVVEDSAPGAVVGLEASVVDPVATLVVGARVATGATVPMRTMAARSSGGGDSGGLQAVVAGIRTATSRIEVRITALCAI